MCLFVLCPSLRLFLRLCLEDAAVDLELLLVEGQAAAVAEAQRRAVRHARRAVRGSHALARTARARRTRSL